MVPGFLTEVRLDPFLEQCDEGRIEKREVVRDAEADQPVEDGMRREHPFERVALLIVHREDDIGPLEHALVDAHQSVFARAG